MVRPRTGRDRGRSAAHEHLEASAASDAEAGASCWGGRIIGYSVTVTVALNYIARGSFRSVRALQASHSRTNTSDEKGKDEKGTGDSLCEVGVGEGGR